MSPWWPWARRPTPALCPRPDRTWTPLYRYLFPFVLSDHSLISRGSFGTLSCTMAPNRTWLCWNFSIKEETYFVVWTHFVFKSKMQVIVQNRPNCCKTTSLPITTQLYMIVAWLQPRLCQVIQILSVGITERNFDTIILYKCNSGWI